MILKMCAKCSDMFSADLFDNDGEQLVDAYNGYVPNFMPGSHYGDYIILDIDTDSGQILNWKAPTPAVMQRDMGGETEGE